MIRLIRLRPIMRIMSIRGLLFMCRCMCGLCLDREFCGGRTRLYIQIFEWITFVIVHVAINSFPELSLFLKRLLLPMLIVRRIGDLILSVHCLHTAAPLIECPSNV